MAEQLINRVPSVPAHKLWFGFTGSACAWVGLAVGDVLLAWWACLQEGQSFGFSSVRPGIGFAFFGATIILLALAIAAGLTSYRNWKKLSSEASLKDAEGRGREEFMALMGVFVSVTLGFGLVWLTIPLLILNVCVRAR
jgi:hypothetical protein